MNVKSIKLEYLIMVIEFRKAYEMKLRQKRSESLYWLISFILILILF